MTLTPGHVFTPGCHKSRKREKHVVPSGEAASRQPDKAMARSRPQGLFLSLLSLGESPAKTKHGSVGKATRGSWLVA